MQLTRALGAAALLGMAVAQQDDLPFHKRNTFDPFYNDFSYLSMLSKRDECSTALGDKAMNSNCAPSQTLCCTRSSQDFPSCQQYLNKGWCCVGAKDSDICYVDTPSVCDEEGAVQCKNLEKGTSKACCPKSTTCEDDQEATEDNVRCNIPQGDLIAADDKAKAKTSSASGASQTDGFHFKTEDDNSKNLNGGAIAGIVIGCLAAIALIAGLAFFFIRRKKKAAYTAAKQGSPRSSSANDAYSETKTKEGLGYEYYGANELVGDESAGPSELGGGHAPPSELGAQSPPVELMGDQTYAELDSGSLPADRNGKDEAVKTAS